MAERKMIIGRCATTTLPKISDICGIYGLVVGLRFQPGCSIGRVRITADAHVDLATLMALTTLLRTASSNAPLSRAPSLSHDQNQGEADATADEAAAGETPGATADRPVVRRTAERHWRHAGVVPAGGGHPSGADGFDNTIAPEHADKIRIGSMAETGHDR